MALDVKVGTFAKTTAAATASQPVTGVGFEPKALILFTMGKTTANAWSAHYFGAIGLTAGAASSGSHAFSSQDNLSTTNSSQRTAAKALTIVQYGETLLAECDLTSFDSDGFTLSWTTNDANAYQIAYIALGGTTITGAKVLALSGTGTGDRAFTGAGFQADLAITINGAITAALPASSGFADGSIGFASRRGEGAIQFRASDNVAVNQQRSAICPESWSGTNSDVLTPFHTACVKSFDADGITYSVSTALANLKGFVLLIQGGIWNVLRRRKPPDTAPVTQALVADVVPQIVIMGAASRLPRFGAIPSARWGIGASDGSAAACMTLTDERTTNPNEVHAIFRDDALFVKADNGTETTEALAGVPSFGETYLEIPWTTNDTVMMEELLLIGGDTAVSSGGGSGSPPAASGGETSHVFVG